MVLSTDTPVTVNYLYWISQREDNTNDYLRTTKIKHEFIGDTVYYYEYDELGNITKIREGERVDDTTTVQKKVDKISYEYDELSQLTRENNKYLNQTIIYTYDKGGNLTKKAIYPYTDPNSDVSGTPTTINYGYGNSSWKDLLTSYDGKTITYDKIGNPLSYLGYTLKWNGRQLISLSGNGVVATYKYDADGLRSYKKVGSVESTYQYLGGKLVYEKRGDIELRYGYNSFGDLAVIRYTTGGTTYTYYVVCNSRGDVENIYKSNGTVQAHYTYDSWGNVISVTNANGKEITDTTNIGLVNPIRYRGYYYDTETGYYYLQSRYYNPQVGRFLNEDGYISTGQGILGFNMFAYCGNNPVIYSDKTGHAPRFAYLMSADSGHVGNSTKLWVAKNIAKHVGWNATIADTNDSISIDLSTTGEAFRFAIDTIGIDNVSNLVAIEACAKFKSSVGRDIIFTEKCVAYEIQEHIEAYLWSTGERALPNLISIGFMVIKRSCDPNNVYLATVDINIHEADATTDILQAVMFNYYHGIREEYQYLTGFDPYAGIRW